MDEMITIPCTFGNVNATINIGLTGSYTALREPVVSEGCALRTYPTQPGTSIPVDLPSASLRNARVKVDGAGHILLD